MSRIKTVANTVLALAVVLGTGIALAQSARCLSCGNAVANTSRVGDTCPHCGVRWGWQVGGGGGGGSSRPVSPPALPQPKVSGPKYRWGPVKGSDNVRLYMDDSKIGEYNPYDGTFRRYTKNGALTEPVPPPWESGKGKEKPTGLDMKPSTDSKSDTKADATTKETKTPDAKAEKADAKGDEEQSSTMPPWAPYAGAGAVALLAIIAGAVMQKRSA